MDRFEAQERQRLAMELLAMAEDLWPGVTRYKAAYAPSMAIHHIDGNPLNNDPANLRMVPVKANRK